MINLFHISHLIPLEVFTGKAPFFESTAPAVITSIMDGRRPERPNHSGFTDHLWELTRKCLAQEPLDRPNVEQVLGALKRLPVFPLSSGWHTLHSRILTGKG